VPRVCSAFEGLAKLLRYFAGLTRQQAAEALGISVATADRDWSYARAGLLREMSKGAS
jgi:DNA-directed RNA polymerase specialized sigma24 family protein